MTTSPVGLQVAAVPPTMPPSQLATQPAAGATPDLATAIQQLSSAVEALRSALAGMQSISGGGGTGTGPGELTGGGGASSGCSCGQATAGAGALGSPEQTGGANGGVEAPKEDKPKQPKREEAAAPAPDAGAGSAPSGYRIQDPLPGATNTSKFGEIAAIRKGRAHGGHDLARPQGTAIKAAAPGKVVEVKNDSDGYGHYITIDHGNNRFTRYAHMVSKSPLGVGQTVNVGDVVGKVGSTGNSTGPHLHFEVLIGGTGASNRVDPAPYLAGDKKL